MKVLLLFIFSSLASLQAHAQAQAGDAGTIGEAQQTMQNALQEIARTDSEIKQSLSACYDDLKGHDNVSDCLWQTISAEKKQQVIQAIQTFQEENKNTTIGVNLRKQTQREDSPNKNALDALEKFYGDRLEEELGTKGKSFVVNDQLTYFNLAKTQIGKNVMSAWSSFCIDAAWYKEQDNSPLKLIIFSDKNKSKRENVRKSNLEALKNVKDGAAQNYTSCVTHIALLCRQAKGKSKQGYLLENGEVNPNQQSIDYERYTNEDDIEISAINNFHSSPIDGISTSTKLENSDFKYTNQRACETLAYTNSLQKQLAATEKVAAAFDQGMTDQGAKRTGPAVGNYQGQEKQLDYDKATTITSGDLQNEESSYYDAVASNEERLAACRSDANINDENCKALLAQGEDKEELRANGTALLLESAVIKDKIDKAIEDNNEDAKRELLTKLRPELGDESEIAELSGSALQKEFQKLEQEYKNERTALIESLSSKVDQLSKAEQDNEETSRRIRNATDSILSRGNQYVQLMHFNNIVTGFLSVTTGSGPDAEKSKNTRVLNLELESIASVDGGIDGSFTDQRNQELTDEITQNNEGIGGNASADPSKITTFGSEDIAKFNDYVIE